MAQTNTPTSVQVPREILISRGTQMGQPNTYHNVTMGTNMKGEPNHGTNHQNGKPQSHF
jgi:hypothetical protein